MLAAPFLSPESWDPMTRPRLAFLALLAVHCGSPASDLERTFEAAAAHDVPELRELAGSETPEVRFEALRSLVRDPSDEAAHAVTELLAEVGVEERREILVTLLETGRRDATTDSLLGTLCRDADPGNRAAAFVGVGRLASLTAAFLERLVAGLDDPDAGVALGAFAGLRDQGWNAAQPLADALAEARLANTEHARILLTQITGHPLREAKAWRTWLLSTEAAMVRVRAEGHWNPAAAAQITRALDDDDPVARRAALLALVEVAPLPEALTLVQASNAKYPEERARATPLLRAPPAPVAVARRRTMPSSPVQFALEGTPEDAARFDAALAEDCSPELGTVLALTAAYYARPEIFKEASTHADFGRIERCGDPRLSALATLAAWNTGQLLHDIAGTRTRLLSLSNDADTIARVAAIEALGELGAWTGDSAIRDHLIGLLTAEPARSTDVPAPIPSIRLPRLPMRKTSVT
jgi:hypothetical protein